jgi:hypothetical protein
LGHLFLLGSELRLRGGKLLLLCCEFVYAAAHGCEIACYGLKLPRHFRRRCGRAGRCSLGDWRWLRWCILQ